MEGDTGWVAGLGGAVGVLLYGAAEMMRRILKKGHPDDPFVKKMQDDISHINKRLAAIVSQLEYMADGHHDVEKRVAKIERNGKNGR